VTGGRARASLRPSFEQVMRLLRKRTFAVLSTADDRGTPQAAGVVYAAGDERVEFFVMTRTHLQKARNIAINRNVSFVVPLTRAILGLLPPPCIQFQGEAEILDRAHAEGRRAFSSFLLGRTILRMYEQLERRGETRVCFLRIEPGPVMFTYAVGIPIWRLGSRIEHGAARVEVPAGARSRAPRVEARRP
jgi:uncharacterized protein YhbP (UPF0306 family)